MSTSTDSPRKDGSNINDFKLAAPIPILSSPHRRRASISSSSDGSPTSPPSVQTPNSLNLAPSSPTNSSFFSYFTSTSPKSSASFPYRRPPGFGPPPVFEDEDGQEIEVRNTSLHQRRATTTWTGNARTTSQRVAPAAPPVIEEQHARGAGVLRRLSLGGGLNSALFQGTSNNMPPSPPAPTTPPPSAVTPPTSPGFATNQHNTDVRSRVRRSATLSIPSTNPRHRAPSPMGERILKGHFDGFN